MRLSLEKCSSCIPNLGKVKLGFFQVHPNLVCGDSKELFFKKDRKNPMFPFIGIIFFLNSNLVLSNYYRPKKSKTLRL